MVAIPFEIENEVAVKIAGKYPAAASTAGTGRPATTVTAPRVLGLAI
jgi:hypothetical protein